MKFSLITLFGNDPAHYHQLIYNLYSLNQEHGEPITSFHGRILYIWNQLTLFDYSLPILLIFFLLIEHSYVSSNVKM